MILDVVAVFRRVYSARYGGGANLLGVAVLMCIAVIAWTAVLMLAFLKGYEKFCGKLRLDAEVSI